MSPRIPEGFPRQRLVIVPSSVLQRCEALPLIRDLYVTHIGSFPTAPNHYVERPAGAAEVVLIYCLSGVGSLDLGRGPIELTEGDAVVIPPATPHSYQAAHEDPWSVFWVHFSGERASEAMESIGVNQESPRLRVPDTARLRNVFEDLFANLNYNYTDAGLLATTAGLMRLLGEIALRRSSTTTADDGRPAADRVRRAVRFMERHVDKKLSLADVAAATGQSASHFGRLFRSQTGQSAIAYFLQLKIRKASGLLDQTEMSVKEVARAVGYDDPYYFSRLFKKLQGCSPSEYRRLVEG